MPSSPAFTNLAPPPEGIYRSFDDLLTSIQRVAKDNGYGVVKLRASNYRDGKPTRYDLVCDRGGVKYSSTAKKRNPSTRKVDCPFRAKAVCEVQLQNQWRFQVQDPRHNHEARLPTTGPGQENTPLAQSLRSLTNKLDRMAHDFNQGLGRMDQRFDLLEKRMDTIEQRLVMNNNNNMMGNNMQSNMGNNMNNNMSNNMNNSMNNSLGGNMPGSMGGSMGNNMGGSMNSMGSNMGSNMGNNLGPPGIGGPSGLPSGPLDNRLNNVEARMNAMENRVTGMEGLPLVDDVESRLLSQSMV